MLGLRIKQVQSWSGIDSQKHISATCLLAGFCFPAGQVMGQISGWENSEYDICVRRLIQTVFWVRRAIRAGFFAAWSRSAKRAANFSLSDMPLQASY